MSEYEGKYDHFEKVAHKVEIETEMADECVKHTVWLSNVDDSYVCADNVEGKEWLKGLMDRDMTLVQNAHGVSDHTSNIGFSEKEQKWHGWSHRAAFAFGIGSECTQGHAHFKASNEKEFQEDCLRFWGDTDMKAKDTNKIKATVVYAEQEGKKGCLVSWQMSNKTKKDIRGTTRAMFKPYPEVWGKGEWKAETMEDAKQMAIDFADGVG